MWLMTLANPSAPRKPAPPPTWPKDVCTTVSYTHLDVYKRQLLQRALGLPTPRYLHTPLVLGPNHEKLSKQNGAAPINTTTPEAARQALNDAARVLGLPLSTAESIADALANWITCWGDRYGRVGVQNTP